MERIMTFRTRQMALRFLAFPPQSVYYHYVLARECHQMLLINNTFKEHPHPGLGRAERSLLKMYVLWTGAQEATSAPWGQGLPESLLLR